jgi:hypothetical protein
MARMLDNLRKGSYKALVLDAPVVDYTVAANEQCDLYSVGESFETFNLAIGFAHDTPNSLIKSISAAILDLQVCDGSVAMLYTCGCDRVWHQPSKDNSLLNPAETAQELPCRHSSYQ